LKQLTERHVGAVVIITSNDAFVNNAWGKLLINEAKFDHHDIPSFPQIYFASDDDVKFSLTNAVAVADNKRTGRYALVVGDDRKVKYAGYENGTGLSVSGIDKILEAKF
jgi:alkyl hydroperoxide reductase 1